MPITPSELKWFRPALVSNTPAANGGRMTLTEIPSNVKNNILPDVSRAQREAGVTHWRKVFVAVRNADNLTLMDPRLSLESGTPGDSYVLLHVGTQTDTQDAVSARPHGYGTLAEAVLAEATTIVVTVEHADYATLDPNPFQVGDLIRIDARPTILDDGAHEYREIDSLSYDGDALTIALTQGLESGYDVGAHVASVIVPEEVAARVGPVTATGGVTYNATGHLLTTALGAIQQTWTVTVTNAASGALAVAGDLLGAVGTGATGVPLAPLNPATNRPYFTLLPGGWGGTPANGDTIQFTASPAAVPIWYQRVVPAGAAAISSDPVKVCVEGESA